MSRAETRIAAAISAQGPISIAQFMALALVEAQSGYYATRNPLGAGGDFITAPEISQMFGELVGLWLAQAWHDQARPARPILVELGPGSGALMADALRALKLAPDFRDALDVYLVETSPVLKTVQQEKLAQTGAALHWVPSLDAVPAERPLFLAANEFFDALPIRQFVKTARGWCERMVTLAGNGALAFALAPTPLPEGHVPASRDGAPDGGVYETSPAAAALAEEIAHRIARCGGAALIVDYGYDAPDFGETLQAIKDHRFADILTAPGESDLSAHVDFTALGEAVTRGGACAYGPVEQGAFLVSIGIVERAERLARAAGVQSLTGAPLLQAQLDRLLLPDQMGTLFKALAIVPRAAQIPAGF